MIWHRRHFAGLNFRPSVRETNIHETVWYFHGYSFSVLGSWLLFFFLLNIWVMLHKPLSEIMLTKCCSPNSITNILRTHRSAFKVKYYSFINSLKRNSADGRSFSLSQPGQKCLSSVFTWGDIGTVDCSCRLLQDKHEHVSKWKWIMDARTSLCSSVTSLTRCVSRVSGSRWYRALLASLFPASLYLTCRKTHFCCVMIHFTASDSQTDITLWD